MIYPRTPQSDLGWPRPGTPISWDSEQAAGLWWYVPCWEGSGNTLDELVTGHTTTVRNTLAPGTFTGMSWSIPDGSDVGAAPHWSGSNVQPVFRHPNESFLNSNNGDVTLSFWAWVPSGNNNSAFAFVDNSNNIYHQCHLPYSGVIYWDFGGQFVNRLSVTFPASAYSSWHHFVFTGSWSKSAQGIWVDGVRIATASPAVHTSDKWTSLCVGAWPDNTGFTGYLKDFRVYNWLKSTDEIARLYDPGTRWDIFQQPRISYFSPTPSPVSGYSAALLPAM